MTLNIQGHRDSVYEFLFDAWLLMPYICKDVNKMLKCLILFGVVRSERLSREIKRSDMLIFQTERACNDQRPSVSNARRQVINITSDHVTAIPQYSALVRQTPG